MIKYDKQSMDAIPFLEFLKKVQNLLDDFGYSGSLDQALYTGQDLGRDVLNRVDKEYAADTDSSYLDDELADNIRVDVGILDHYNFNSNQRSKKDVIEDFRLNLQTDIGDLIS